MYTLTINVMRVLFSFQTHQQSDLLNFWIFARLLDNDVSVEFKFAYLIIGKVKHVSYK